MNTDDIKSLVTIVKQTINRRILNYYSAHKLTTKQKMMFLRNGIVTECRRRDKEWFEIDMIEQ